MMSQRKFAICRTLVAGAMSLLPGTAWAQVSGTSASATAGALCCTVRPGADVQGSAHLTPNIISNAAASYSSPGVGITHPVIATASAYANLATGKIGAIGTSTDYGFTSASGSFRERLRFNIAGASATTVTPIVFNIVYHGTIDPGYGGVNTGLIFNVNQTRADGSYVGTGGLGLTRDKGSGNDRDSYYFNVQNSGWLSFDVTPNSDADTHSIRAVFGVVGASSILDISKSLSLRTSQGANANFLNTASLGLSVPDGVTYNSASGVFLSQAGAVPEPATWTMMIVGFGAVGMTTRRSRSRALA